MVITACVESRDGNSLALVFCFVICYNKFTDDPYGGRFYRKSARKKLKAKSIFDIMLEYFLAGVVQW